MNGNIYTGKTCPPEVPVLSIGGSRQLFLMDGTYYWRRCGGFMPLTPQEAYHLSEELDSVARRGISKLPRAVFHDDEVLLCEGPLDELRRAALQLRADDLAEYSKQPSRIQPIHSWQI